MKASLCAALVLVLSSPALAREVRPEHDLLRYGVVETVPGMDRVRVQDVTYKSVAGMELQMSVYLPPAAGSQPLPVVVFVNGVGDRPGFAKVRSWGQYTSWPRLVAASGLAAATFDSRGGDQNLEDVRDAFAHVREKGATLGIDPSRIAAWACSANVRAALKLLTVPGPLPAGTAVLYYGGGEVEEFRRELPVLFVRAGKDRPQQNEQIDQLVARALAANAPWTLLNVPDGHHAFDVLDDTEESRAAVRATVAYLQAQLRPSASASRSPDPARAAAAHLFAGEWAEAETAYARYVETHPGDPDALVRLGNAQMEMKNPDEAVATLKKALALDPEIGQAWVMLGRIEAERRNDDAAEEALTRAIALVPDDPEAHYQLGSARLARRDVPGAIGALERAVTLNPGNGWAWNSLAMAYLQAKQPVKAAESFERVLPFAPQNPGLLYNTACAYSLAGDTGKALDLLDRAVAAGFKDKAGMMADPDLAAIRTDPRFAEIAGRL